jgi:hypothetical protein
MFYWIYDLPTWTMVGLFCVFFVGVTWLGILFVRPILRAILGRHAGLNDSVGYLLGAHGVYLGVLLGLLAVSAYQNYTNVESIVGSETTKLAGLYRDVDSYPEPYRTKLTAILKVYTEYVIKEAWPLQKKGLIPTKGATILNEFQKELMKFEPKTVSQQILHTEVVHQFNGFTEARRARLQAVTTGLPAVLWAVVLIGAGVAIFLMWILDMKLMSHFVLSGIVSFYLATLIALVAAMDNPFLGEISVSSEPFQMVLDTVMTPEPPTVGNPEPTSPGAPAAKKEESLKSILSKTDTGYVPPSEKAETKKEDTKVAIPPVLNKPDTATPPPATKDGTAKKEESLKSILSKPDTGYVPPAAKEGGLPADSKVSLPAALTKPAGGPEAKPKAP